MSKFAENVIGGWSATTALSLHSGLPWGVTELTNTSNTYSSALRANISCDPNISSFSSKAAMLNQYFNTSCFQSPAVSYFGDSARNVGFGPGWEQIDATLEKEWRIQERFKLQLRIDSYNVTNRANFANPATSQGEGNFGTISSLAAGAVPREFQFGLKLKF